MKKIIILTGSELRHTFFRKYMALSNEISVLHTYCEGAENSLSAILQEAPENSLRLKHIRAREQSEIDFWGLFTEYVPDKSKPIFLPKGDINLSEYTDSIIAAKPDLLIAYGCSIVRGQLLRAFQNRFLNVHLGLSPYYRGSGTNFWPLVHNEPEYVGATYMHIDAGIDTGEIIHQVRADITWGDSPVQIGNRLIEKMAQIYKKIIISFEKLDHMPQFEINQEGLLYKNSDFTDESVAKLYRNFNGSLIEDYLSNKIERCEKVPIVENNGLV